MKERLLTAGGGVLIGIAIGAGIFFVYYWIFHPSQKESDEKFSAQQSATTTAATAPGSGPTSSTRSQDCQSAAPVIDLLGNPSAATKDTVHVYGQYCYALANANPNTFIALDYYYGKDANGVWLLADPTPYGVLIPAQIVGADPATFTLIPDRNYNSGFPVEALSGIYTKDKNHVYVYGAIMAGADPDAFMIDDPPTITACEFDANESYLKYYRGQMVPQVDSQSSP
jgi:DKNYY family